MMTFSFQLPLDSRTRPSKRSESEKRNTYVVSGREIAAVCHEYAPMPALVLASGTQ